MMNILKNKKGMTLVEVIAGLLLFTIIAISVSAILVPMLRVYASANELAECNALLDNVANQIIRDVSGATAPLEIDNSVPSVTIAKPKKLTYIINGDGVLCYINDGGDEVPVLSKTYYKNKKVTFTCDLTGIGSEKAYTLTVSVLNQDDEAMLSRAYEARPLAIPDNQY